MGVTNSLNREARSVSYQEDATPLDPSSSSGGVGQATLTVTRHADDKYLDGKPLTIGIDPYGSIDGRILDTSMTGRETTFVADSILGLLNVYRVTPPYNGTLGGLLSAYFNSVGAAVTFQYDAGISSRAITAPGWAGNVWDHVKALMSAQQLTLSLTAGNVVRVREAQTGELGVENYITSNLNINRQASSRAVEVHWYNHQWKTKGVAYPRVDEVPSTYQVNSEESLEFIVNMNATLTSVNQPTCVDFVGPGSYEGTNGVYCVFGNDGIMISAARWNTYGGRIKTELGDTPDVLKVTIIGMRDTSLAPFTIGVPVPDGSLNSLHITGTGTFTRDEKSVLSTGSTNAVTAEDVGVVVQNPFITTKSQAFTTGLHTAAAQNLSYTLSYGTNKINKAFGNAPGNMFRFDDAKFRVNSLSYTQAGVSFDASSDTRISDFNSEWSGKTFAQFNAENNGRMFSDFAVAPLRRI